MNSQASNPDRVILHADMDAFFAAVEQHDHPELRGLPVIVGSPPDQRGVVCTASYEARRFGVRSAMPSRTAGKLCPQGIFLPVRRERYSQISAQIMGIFRSFTPLVEPLSIDEAFLDISRISRPGNPVEIAREIRAAVRAGTGLTVSVGVAPNKFLAKLASDMNKPDGLTVTPFAPEAIHAFLAPLPARRIWGVGPKTADLLLRHQVHRIEDLQNMRPDECRRRFGERLGDHLWHLARGEDQRPVHAGPREEKSISREETFGEDNADLEHVRQTLVGLVEEVGRRLRRAGRLASMGQIKIRYSDFETHTRQQALPGAPTDLDYDLIHCALELWRKNVKKRPIRLIGFGVGNLIRIIDTPAKIQPSLFPDPEEERRDRERNLTPVLDQLREQYGPDILRRDW